MSKRARSDRLTGGTEDVNPQIWHLHFVASAPATYTETEFPTPISRMPKSDSVVTIMEFLKIGYYGYSLGAIGQVAETAFTLSNEVLTRAVGAAAPPSNPAWLDGMYWGRCGAFTAGGTYSDTASRMEWHDLTDGAGHGILVATDSIYCACWGTQVSTSNGGDIVIYYRFKNVGLAEYIGIVQSQQ